MSSAPTASTLALSEEQILLAENLHRFLESHNSLEQRRQRLARPVPDRLALWPGLIDMGLAGAALPESAGGFGDDARTLAIVMFELGRSLVIEPYLACAVVAGRVLLRLSDKTLREKWINRVLGGELITALAHDGGVDPFAWPKPRARKEQFGFTVTGRMQCVRHADVGGEFLVTAMLDGAPAVFRVPREALKIQPYSLMDGASAADLVLDDLRLGPGALLSFDAPVSEVLADAFEWGVFSLAAEVLGIISAANTATFEYLNTRKQFGVALATFQALQHRAADMWIAEQELFALMNAAIPAMGPQVGVARSSLLSALKCLADKSGRRIGHEAIQMHGGMGVSDELKVSHWGRRLAVIRTELGSQMLHAMRFDCVQDLSELLCLQESREDREWRDRVAAFTERYLPPLIAAKGNLGLKIEKEDYVAWQRVLYEHGLFAGAWPREFGGQGWDLVKQLLFTQETALHDAPWISPYGVNMVGPVLYTFGSEPQKRQHLPGILSNSVWWCQGYSEPGAGSDLANLKTSAELSGDHYVVNGAKLWTTEAHWADWMHCLVRTAKTGKPQAGITFLLIDMTSPGISIKPIITIDGMHHTNAVFLDDVRVPISNRVGEEGEGWRIAKFLLSNERVSIGDTGQKLRLLRHVQARYQTVVAENQLPNAMRTLLTHRLSEVSMQLLTLCAMERQFINAWASGKRFGVEASIIKIRSTEILQAITEVGLELEGSLAAAYDPKDLLRPPNFERDAVQRASSVGYEYLYGRCWTIFGGTNEIQRNIIAKGILSPETVS